MLARAAEIKANGTQKRLRRAVDDRAFVVDFRKPPIRQNQRRAQNKQEKSLQTILIRVQELDKSAAVAATGFMIL